MMENLEENIKIIQQAYMMVKDEMIFRKSTLYMQCCRWSGVSEKDYIQLDYKLKAIRQDSAKILTIMNVINTTYTQYQQDEYKASYFSVIDNQAIEELGCFIEYLFAKYRVILDYIEQIMEICIVPQLNDEEQNEYCKLKKSHTKFKFLLQYVVNNIEEVNDVMNMDWFQSIRMDRDFIIHDGATCLTYDDKKDLLFKVMTTDALDEEEKLPDAFYANDNGLIYYERYWGLYISKLVVFAETIFAFLLNSGNLDVNTKAYLDYTSSYYRNEFTDSDGNKFNDKQEVLNKILRKLFCE